MSEKATIKKQQAAQHAAKTEALIRQNARAAGRRAAPFHPIEKPEHYNRHPAGIECIDVIEHFMGNIATAIKLLWRAGFSKRDPLPDLESARWYIQREIDRVQKLVP